MEKLTAFDGGAEPDRGACGGFSDVNAGWSDRSPGSAFAFVRRRRDDPEAVLDERGHVGRERLDLVPVRELNVPRLVGLGQLVVASRSVSLGAA